MQLLFTGEWSPEMRWEFYLTNQMPPKELCTAVFCIPFQENQILLVQHQNRNWEMPGGHVEDDEKGDILRTLQREVLEEGGVSIIQPQMIGYRKVIATVPQKQREIESYYPFPYSYIPFYIAKISIIHAFEAQHEIIQRKFFFKDAAIQALQRDLNFKILDFAYSLLKM